MSSIEVTCPELVKKMISESRIYIVDGETGIRLFVLIVFGKLLLN